MSKKLDIGSQKHKFQKLFTITETKKKPTKLTENGKNCPFCQKCGPPTFKIGGRGPAIAPSIF